MERNGTYEAEDAGFNYDHDLELQFCGHISIVSISETKCQCMDCLRIWDKEPGFRSDWPQYDRG